jgi:3-hydroxyethyl bacteriochlorophyllide a dehydrogenase
MQTQAIVFEQPERIGLQALHVADPGDGDVVVHSAWSGISAGTEKLLFEGRMPAFPGMGYPLGARLRDRRAGRLGRTDAPSGLEGSLVFVPGARGYRDAAALFGASAANLVAPADRVIPISEDLARDRNTSFTRRHRLSRAYAARHEGRRIWSSATASSAV